MESLQDPSRVPGVDSNKLLPRGVSVQDFEGAARQTEKFGEEPEERVVGSAFLGAGSEADFQGVAMVSSNLVLCRSGLNANRQSDGFAS